MMSTSYSVGPNAVLTSAVQHNKAGYVLESYGSTMTDGAQGGDWAVLGNTDGSEANMTVIVFSSVDAAQAYYGTYVAGVKGLPGYTDVSSDLNSFQQYGKCYAYGEDVDSIAVVNGICSKGNVILQTHLVSGVSFEQLGADMVSLMGSLYNSVD